MNKEIRQARLKLAKLYKKYTDEFHEVTLKIDKYLETLEDAPN